MQAFESNECLKKKPSKSARFVGLIISYRVNASLNVTDEFLDGSQTRDPDS